MLSIIFLGTVRPVLADAVTYTVTQSAGQYQYEFTLLNSGSTGGTLFDLFLAIPTDIVNIDAGAIGTPAGWGDANGGLLFFGPDASPSTSFIQWSADFSGAFDVPAAGSLSGFSFSSAAAIAPPIQFAVNGFQDLAEARESVNPIPEPAGAALMLLGASCLVAYRTLRLRQRRRLMPLEEPRKDARGQRTNS